VRELRLTDAALQALIAPALHERFKSAGMHTLERDAEHHSIVLPVRINLAGTVTIERDDDGTWVFRQELNQTLADRTSDANALHQEAFTDARGQ
jgi:hypothetical protein